MLFTWLVPGVAVNARLDGEDRLVTFFSGSAVRERLVDLSERRPAHDDQARLTVGVTMSLADGISVGPLPATLWLERRGDRGDAWL